MIYFIDIQKDIFYWVTGSPQSTQSTWLYKQMCSSIAYCWNVAWWFWWLHTHTHTLFILFSRNCIVIKSPFNMESEKRRFYTVQDKFQIPWYETSTFPNIFSKTIFLFLNRNWIILCWFYQWMYFDLEIVTRYYAGASISENCRKPVISSKKTALLIQSVNFFLLYRTWKYPISIMLTLDNSCIPPLKLLLYLIECMT